VFKLKEIARAMALVGISGGLAQVALADDASSQSAAKPEKIEVVGTNIKRVTSESAMPVQVVTHQEIVDEGVQNLTQLISNLAASTGGLSDISGGNSFAPGSSSVSLRNLGSQSTLVLLNGRRVSSNAFANFNTTFVNTDSFPIDVIERVEVLKSGASAIYGSDAVAGVINIVTRKDYEGLDLQASREQSITSGKFGTTTASLTGGFGDINKDHYNLMFNADMFHREAVAWKPLEGYQNPRLIHLAGKGYGSFSTVAFPGNEIDQETGAVKTLGCSNPNEAKIGSFCRYDRVADWQAVPQSDRAQGFVSGELQIDGTLTAFAEASFSDQKTSATGAHYTYTESAPLASWGTLSGTTNNFNYMGLNPQDPLNVFGAAGDNAAFRYRFVDMPNTHNTEAKQDRFLAGLRGTLGEHDWETAIGTMGSWGSDLESGNFPSASGWKKLIGCYDANCGTQDPNSGLLVSNDPNYFHQPNGYVAGGPNSPAVLNQLFPVFGTNAKYRQIFWDGKISGPLANLFGGEVNYATGAELRHETLLISPTANSAAGDIVDVGASTADGSRSFSAIFGELEYTPIKSVEMDAALRADKFPNFKAHISPKFSVKWNALDQLAFRGTIENGFRAPNLIESGNTTFASFSGGGVSDDKRCPAASKLITDLTNAINNTTDPNALANMQAALQQAQTECNGSPAQLSKGNPALQPEISHSMSFGVVFEPIKSLSGSVDYWYIHRTNTINILTAQQAVDQEASNPAGVTRYPSNIPDPTFSANDKNLGGQNDFVVYGVPKNAAGNYVGYIQTVNTKFINAYEQKTSGIDFNLKGKWNVPVIGKVGTELNATYVISYKDASVASISENLAGTYGIPRTNANLKVDDTYGPHHGGFRLNYTSGTGLQSFAADPGWNLAACTGQGVPKDLCHVPSITTTDVFYDYTGIKNLTVSGRVLNVFGRYAAVDARGFGGVGNVGPVVNYDAMGRMAWMGLEYKFF